MAPFDTPDAGLNLRFCQIVGDTMDPTIRRLDYVLVAPAHGYLGEGYYLLSDPFGGTGTALSCSAAGAREEPMIRRHCHNKHYRDQIVSKTYFNEHVIAQIVMTCNVVRPDLLARASCLIAAKGVRMHKPAYLSRRSVAAALPFTALAGTTSAASEADATLLDLGRRWLVLHDAHVAHWRAWQALPQAEQDRRTPS